MGAQQRLAIRVAPANGCLLRSLRTRPRPRVGKDGDDLPPVRTDPAEGEQLGQALEKKPQAAEKGRVLAQQPAEVARMVFKCQDLKIRTLSEVPNPIDRDGAREARLARGKPSSEARGNRACVGSVA